ncbi:hypothetical protein ACN47E_009749 [Coniothyrium glycines]
MAKPADMKALVDLTKTTQTLLIHYQSSLTPSKAHIVASSTRTELSNPLDVVIATTKLLRSHTTTLSLLLITPPLTPSAVMAKIGDVSSGVLSGMVTAASYTPQAGQQGDVGAIMRTEIRARICRLLGTWGDVLALVLKMAESRQRASQGSKDTGPSDSERQEVLSATGVVWEACDALLKLCTDGIVGLVVKKAGELRATVLDAIEELKEWGEDIEDDEDAAEGSDDEDNMFGTSNKLGKDDEALKALLATSIKKLKMISMLYQAIGKRRLKTFPAPVTCATPSTVNSTVLSPGKRLDDLMALLKVIPETVDELASAFYDLDEDEVQELLEKCCNEAKNAAQMVSVDWTGKDDEFTMWLNKWKGALDAA